MSKDSHPYSHPRPSATLSPAAAMQMLRSLAEDEDRPSSRTAESDVIRTLMTELVKRTVAA